MKIVIDISSCKQCPHFKAENPYSKNGLDYMFDWKCDKIKRIIQFSVELTEEDNVDVPAWCPSKEMKPVPEDARFIVKRYNEQINEQIKWRKMLNDGEITQERFDAMYSSVKIQLEYFRQLLIRISNQ